MSVLPDKMITKSLKFTKAELARIERRLTAINEAHPGLHINFSEFSRNAILKECREIKDKIKDFVGKEE